MEVVPALRLTIFIGEDDRWRRGPAYHEILSRARRHDLAGASVVRGLAGFGASGRIHTARILSIADGLPLMIVIVDAEEKIRAFLSHLDELLDGGIAVLDRVEVVRPGAAPEALTAVRPAGTEPDAPPATSATPTAVRRGGRRAWPAGQD